MHAFKSFSTSPPAIVSLLWLITFAHGFCEPSQTGAVDCLNPFSSAQCGAAPLTNTQCSESCSCPSGTLAPQVMTCNTLGSCDGTTVADICQNFQNAEQCYCEEDLNCDHPPVVRTAVHLRNGNSSLETVSCSVHFADLRDCGLAFVLTTTSCLDNCSCDQAGNMTCSAVGSCDAEKAAGFCQSIGKCACGTGVDAVMPSSTREEP